MKFETFKPGRWQQRLKYKSFEPVPVNHDWHWEDPQINVLLESANRALGELNAYSLIVPDIDLFIEMHVVKEAQTSSRIEGTNTGIDEAVLPEEQIKPEKRDDWREVRNYIDAVNYAIAELGNLPLSNRLLRQTHAILLRGAAHPHPGQTGAQCPRHLEPAVPPPGDLRRRPGTAARRLCPDCPGPGQGFDPTGNPGRDHRPDAGSAVRIRTLP